MKPLVQLVWMVLVVGALVAAAPQRPAGWRGDGSGQYPSAAPPTKWSAKENVLWKAEVGQGASSPIIAGSRLFITAEPDLLICLDAETGKELWRKSHKVADVPSAAKAKARIKPNQYGDANPTPVSDGKCVWAFFNTGIVACYDVDGRSRWINWYDMPLTTNYGRTASPLLVSDRLLVHFGPLVCLDATTGKLLWKNGTALATYGTPVATRIGDVDIVVTPGGHAVRIADGKVLASDLGHCMYTSPVVQGRIVYFVNASISAVELPEKAADQFEGKELWFEDLGGDFYASPIVHGGRIYAVNRDAEYYVIDAATGKTVQKKTLDLPPAGRSESPNIYPSLCLAGKHLFVGNDAGESLLIEPGDKCAVVAANSLPGGSGGTPAFSADRIIVRGGKFLYCVGRQPLPPKLSAHQP